MEDNNNSIDSELKGGGTQNGGSGDLPNAVATLVLGIISIIGCFFWGIPGIICGIIAIALHSKDRKVYQSNQSYYANSFKLSNAGNVCAIIGLSLSALYFILVLIIFIGGVGSANFSSSF